MDTVKYILGMPECVDGIGEVFPVELQYYDDFMNVANILCISYDHFFDLMNDEQQKQAVADIFKTDKDNLKLFDLIKFISFQTDEGISIFKNLENVFSIVLRQTVKLDTTSLNFTIEDSGQIDRNNYDDLRKIIMKQNLLFEPKVYKNKITREWAEKALKTRAKNSIDSTIEDMITTIAAMNDKTYKQLRTYTIYQLKAEFNRTMKIKTYEAYLAYRCAGAEDIPNDHFADNIDMFINPTDIHSLFTDKSKLGKLESAVKSK